MKSFLIKGRISNISESEGLFMKKAVEKIASMMHQADPTACFSIEFWDGDLLNFGDDPEVSLCLKTEDACRKIIANGFSGLAEAYAAGEIEIENDIQTLLRLGLAIAFEKNRMPLLEKLRFAAVSHLNRGSLWRAPKNIAHHYDLGNDFYACYLDETMTYSCAYFKKASDSLYQAQLNKYEHIARKLMLQPDESLLDIGCGWGGMLIYAAQHYGTFGTGITLSKNQYDYATSKIAELGLSDRVRILYADYRKLTGTFDKVVSIGMFEHVGQKFIPVFFKQVSRLLKKGGLGLLHTIGKFAPSDTDPWIVNYIFPGGYLPMLYEIDREMAKAGFFILDFENLRLHYAETLDRWSANFEQNIQKIKKLLPNKQIRRWRMFLNASAAGFRYGDLQLFQTLFSNGRNNSLPMTRDHIYRD